MVWDVSVPTELRCSSHRVFSHEIAHVCPCNFMLIHIFLLLFPFLFPIFLLLGQHLVVLLHFLKLLIFLLSHLILKQSSHSGDRFGLLSIFGFFILQTTLYCLFFCYLLINPLLLDRVVEILSVSIVYDFKKMSQQIGIQIAKKSNRSIFTTEINQCSNCTAKFMALISKLYLYSDSTAFNLYDTYLSLLLQIVCSQKCTLAPACWPSQPFP